MTGFPTNWKIMLTVFTICSNNYLAQAKTLGDSLQQHNPHYRFVIFLVDRLAEGVDYQFFAPYELIPVEQIGIDGFDEMVSKYNITELNTAVKPFCFEFLFARDGSVEAIIYLDPDILAYEPFTELDALLQENNIILTPHWFTPIYDDCVPSEQGGHNAGLYNLGFIGVKRSEESQKFLEWWMIKLKDLCFVAVDKGLFVDQIWLNYAPLYYDKVAIIRHLGYNIAYWNFHERGVDKKDGRWFVNGHFPLKFFHFSGYTFDKPGVISKYQNRFTFESKRDIRPLFEHYHSLVIQNRYEQLSRIPCYYVGIRNKIVEAQQREVRKQNRMLRRIARYAKRKIVAVTNNKS